MPNHAKKEPVDYGRSTTHALNTQELWLSDPWGFGEEMLEMFESPDYRPPVLPRVGIRLMEMSRDPEVDFDEVSELLEQDPVLLARVLKVSRSPVYGGLTRIETVKDALVRLGIKTLSEIVFEAALNMRVFRVRGYQEFMDRLYRHSSLTGHLAQVVCGYTTVPAQYAFLCGILHDIGIAAILLAVSERAEGKRPTLEFIGPTIDEIHARAAAHIVRRWNLPSELETVMRLHHRVFDDRYPHPLAAVVCLAEDLAHRFEPACEPPLDRSHPRVLQRAKEALRFSEKQWDLIVSKAEQKYQTWADLA